MIKWLREHHLLHHWSEWSTSYEVKRYVVEDGERHYNAVERWQRSECTICRRQRMTKVATIT